MGRSRRKGRSMGDRLARMSVEQRKHYLEKKAAQEEEDLRRREELVGAFLKRKLSDEQRMGRINEAKLNTKWRTILRQAKTESLRTQLQCLVLGTEDAVAAQDRLAYVLRAQLQQAHQHHTTALNAHACATNALTESPLVLNEVLKFPNTDYCPYR
ncbi:dynein regulatory complex subunit 2-like [Hyalella azteca]|uniref:Dynein regulatory complex subunit 2 n=1 Tax=Hyalella azteca TaxID=294128 RepID=A0A8B7NTE9_HYAAZ|nr:dynein regulatory complex subunit 2-like [Hyalella azteca]